MDLKMYYKRTPFFTYKTALYNGIENGILQIIFVKWVCKKKKHVNVAMVNYHMAEHVVQNQTSL